MNRHWSCICCTAKHLVNLYQASMKEKEKHIETNFVYDAFDHNSFDLVHLDVVDFFKHPKGRIDHLIENGNVQK